MEVTACTALRHRRGAKGYGLDPERNQERGLVRAKTAMRRAIQVNVLDHTLTLTQSDCPELAEHDQRVEEFWAAMREAFGELPYLRVTELQKRGSYHDHHAIKGRMPRLMLDRTRAIWGAVLAKRGVRGNIDVRDPMKGGRGRLAWDPWRLARYMSKYLSKDNVRGFNGRRFSTSAGLVLDAPLRLVRLRASSREGLMAAAAGLLPVVRSTWKAPGCVAFWLATWGDARAGPEDRAEAASGPA
jgi:hypothetical protein